MENDNLNGKEQRFYEDGTVMQEYTLQDGKPHGQMLMYNRSGKVYQQTSWAHGEQTGICKDFFEDGTIYKE